MDYVRTYTNKGFEFINNIFKFYKGEFFWLKYTSFFTLKQKKYLNKTMEE